VSAAKDLLNNYQHIIESISITPGGIGVFDVVVDEQLIYSKKELGRHAEPGEVLGLFEERFARDVERYTKE
jgi:selenoprotein W-related protein